MARTGRPDKHPDGGKSMIDRLKAAGWWKKLTRARPRVTDSGHRVGMKPEGEDDD